MHCLYFSDIRPQGENWTKLVDNCFNTTLVQFLTITTQNSLTSNRIDF